MPTNGTRTAALALFLLPAAALAAPRAWVSATFGIDTGVCSRPAPCRTFTYAITKVDAGGEVNVLDSGGYGEMTITKSVIVNVAPGVTAGIVAAAADGVTINAAPTDEIVLRGLTISTTGTRAGIKALGFGVLHVESCSLNGAGSAGYPIGIFAAPSASARVLIVDTIVRNFYDGIFVGAQVNATIERSRAFGNSEGLFAGIDSRTTIRESVFSGNDRGVMVYNSLTGSTTAVTAANNAISGNTHGAFLYADAGGTAEIVLSANAISENAAAGVYVNNLGGTADLTLSANTVHNNGAGVQMTTSAGSTVARTRNDNVFLHNSGGDVLGGSLATLPPK